PLHEGAQLVTAVLVSGGAGRRPAVAALGGDEGDDGVAHRLVPLHQSAAHREGGFARLRGGAAQGEAEHTQNEYPEMTSPYRAVVRAYSTHWSSPFLRK